MNRDKKTDIIIRRIYQRGHGKGHVLFVSWESTPNFPVIQKCSARKGESIYGRPVSYNRKLSDDTDAGRD